MSTVAYLMIVLFVGLSAAFAQLAGAAASWTLVWLCFFGWLVHTLLAFFQECCEIEFTDDDNDDNKPV